MIQAIGSDIEFRVRENSTNKIVPAGVLDIKGTKGKPEKMKHGGLEIDCCGVEITPKQGYCENEFVDNILGLKQEVAERYKGFSFECFSSHHFDLEVLSKTPQAMVMGCQPDFNAWTNARNQSPMADGLRLRTFGGHLHIEGGNLATIVACDTTLGLWSLVVDTARESKERRLLYGKAGAYREKDYGVEYRVLSNFWADSEERLRLTYKLAAYARTLTVPQIKQMHKDYQWDVRTSIDCGISYSEHVVATQNYVAALLEKVCAKAA